MFSENSVIAESHNCIGGQEDGADSGTCYGIDFFRKSVYGSKSIETVNKEVELFFGRPTLSRPPRLVVSCDSTTLAIIKPHAIVAGIIGLKTHKITNANDRP